MRMTLDASTFFSGAPLESMADYNHKDHQLAVTEPVSIPSQLINPTQRAPINTDLLDAEALLDQYFPDHNLSIILKVAFENGYAKTLIPLLDRIYFSQTFSIPTIVVEAAQVLAHAICDNRYCAVFHAVNMVDLGLDPKEVKALIESQQLPSRYSDLKRWEKSLQLIAVQFHSPCSPA